MTKIMLFDSVFSTKHLPFYVYQLVYFNFLRIFFFRGQLIKYLNYFEIQIRCLLLKLLNFHDFFVMTDSHIFSFGILLNELK